MRDRRLPRVDLPSRSYYLTCCTDRRRPLLREGSAAQMIIDLYAGYRDRGDLRLHGYVVMPDHCHAILTLVGESSVSNLVRKVHGLFAWRWYGKAGHEGPALPKRERRRPWQRRFYDHVIRNEEDWRTRMAYMHDNPVRAGLVAAAVDHPWSSAAFWETGTGPVTCDGITW